MKRKGSPSVNKSVVVCINDGKNVYFMVAHRNNSEIEDSWVYYSPEHEKEFPLYNVVDWHPLP